MNFPILEEVLAYSPASLFRQAPKVEVDCWAHTAGSETYFECNLDTVKLILPTITVAEYEKLPKNFDVSTSYYKEDEMGRSAYFYFTFAVTVTGADINETTGEVKLKYDAKITEYVPDL